MDKIVAKVITTLGSRKFWATVLAGVVVVFADALGLDGEKAGQAVQALMAYVVGQGISDARTPSGEAPPASGGHPQVANLLPPDAHDVGPVGADDDL